MAPIIEELDVVALTRNVHGTHLQKGDLGTVVLVYGDHAGYMVEFVLQTGFTAALMDFEAEEIRPLRDGELKAECYRVWDPEWTNGEMGYVPPISKLPDWRIFPPGQCPKAHLLGYVDGPGQTPCT